MLLKPGGVFLLSWLGLMVALPGVVCAGSGLQERLEGLPGGGAAKISGATLASPGVLYDFYRQRGYRFAWTNDQQVKSLLRLVDRSGADGLRPGDFNVDQVLSLVGKKSPSDLSAQERTDADILLSDALMRLLHHVRYGKVDPKSVDLAWSKEYGPFSNDLVHDLKRVLAASDLEAALGRLTPKPGFYTRLKKELARYRDVAASGGWSSLSSGPLLKPDQSDPRVPDIRKRLRITGEYAGDDYADPEVYDWGLRRAVVAFQKRHNLGPDGVIGPATLAAMNVPVQQRIDQIRINLERMRWVYEKLPKSYLLVDIVGQEVHLFRDGSSVWRSRAVVGRRERPTPVFRDHVEYLELNPTWTVPPTILEQDILPNARENPAYVSEKGLEILDGSGEVIAPDAVNWDVSAKSFPYTLRQPPGDKNALGHVKFMFPNRFSVYLHDTPNRDLFGASERLYSSGCVRVEQPFELAELVLNDSQRWNKDSFERIVESKQTQTVHLKKPLPVILAYWTADAGPDGEVRFRPDIYQRDGQLLDALNGRGPIRIVYRDVPSPERKAKKASTAAADVGSRPVRGVKTTATHRPAAGPCGASGC